jgi:hypothetical protein
MIEQALRFLRSLVVAVPFILGALLVAALSALLAAPG